MPRQYIDPQPFKDRITALEKENADLKEQLSNTTEGRDATFQALADAGAVKKIKVAGDVIEQIDEALGGVPAGAPESPHNPATGRADWPIRRVPVSRPAPVTPINENIGHEKADLVPPSGLAAAESEPVGADPTSTSSEDQSSSSVETPASSAGSTTPSQVVDSVPTDAVPAGPSDPFLAIDKFADDHRAHDRKLTGTDEPSKA